MGVLIVPIASAVGTVKHTGRKGVRHLTDLPEGLYESVVTVLGGTPGIGITEETVKLPIYYETALAELEKLVPGITKLPEDDPQRPAADRAAVYQTALRLLPYWKQQVFKKEQTPAETIERFDVGWAELEAWLTGERDNALGEVDEEYLNALDTGYNGFILTRPLLYPPKPGGCC